MGGEGFDERVRDLGGDSAKELRAHDGESGGKHREQNDDQKQPLVGGNDAPEFFQFHFAPFFLAVGFAGFVSAIAARPSGAQSLDMVMTGYDVYEAIVTPDMVSSDMPLCIELSAGYLALPDFYMIDVPAGEPQRYPLIKPIVVKGQRAFILLKQGDYWLLI